MTMTESYHAPLPTADPNCATCGGTGEDRDFGGACADCLKPGSWRTNNAVTSHVAGGYAPPAAKVKDQELVAWLAAQTWSAFAQDLAGKCGRYGFSEKQLASARKMKATCDAKVAAKAAPQGATPGTGLDLTSIPTGMYAVPGGDTRLKLDIDNVTKGRWAGWVFVKDAAVYGEGRRYGKQKPGGTYVGDVVEALRVILADPKAAAQEYGRLTGTCGICRRHLEDETSVAYGIGPVCRQKTGW